MQRERIIGERLTRVTKYRPSLQSVDLPVLIDPRAPFLHQLERWCGMNDQGYYVGQTRLKGEWKSMSGDSIGKGSLQSDVCT